MRGMMRVGRAMAVAALVLPMGLPGLPVPGFIPTAQAAQAAQGNQGLQGGWAVDDGGSTDFPHALSAQFPIMQRAGAGWVRLNFRLGACFSDWTSIGCNGMTALQVYDQVVAGARDHGLQVLGLLSNESWHGGPAEWNANNAETTPGNGDNAYLEGFAGNVAGVLAAHFAGTVSHWQVWNEPNAGGSTMYPSNFAWLLTRAYTAVKAADPWAQVISGGLIFVPCTRRASRSPGGRRGPSRSTRWASISTSTSSARRRARTLHGSWRQCAMPT